jgi:hypothetical protein
MAFLKKIPKFLMLIIISLAISSGCAPSRKNPYYEKRIKASRHDTKPLGKNKYYFSDHYQKKLTKSYKRR